MIDLKQLSGLRRRRHKGRIEPLHLLRYHGLWGPGVRLLQNLRFRSKMLLLLVSLALPLALLVAQLTFSGWTQWRDLQRSVTALTIYRAVADEHMALGRLGSAMFDADSDSAARDAVAPALAGAQQAAQGLRSVLSRAPEAAARLRDALHVLRDDDHVLQALVADMRPGAAGQPPAKYVALMEVQAGLDMFRSAVLGEGGAALHDQRAAFAIHIGALDAMPLITHHLWRSERPGLRVYAEEGRPGHAMRLLESTVVMLGELDGLRRHLDALSSSGLADAADLRRSIDQLTGFGALARRLVTVGLVAGSEADVTRAMGMDAAGFLRQARASQILASGLYGQLLDLAARTQQQRLDQTRAAMLKGMLSVLGCLAVMAYLLVCVVKVVGGGLAELGMRVDALAKGDLSEKPEARGSDEVGQALTALATSTHRMSTLFEAVTQGVAAVSFASREVAVGNAGLNGRTGDIQRSIEDVGQRARSSMEAMNRAGSEVDRIAAHMREVRTDAHRSRRAAQELANCMSGLQAKSREIGRVVMLVESVAHQTRLLSLNASVEAARAGTAGKGFAVVAQEVRQLAQRSESAAHKIAEIVKASVDEIAHGNLLTERVGESVRKTDERVGEVSAIMGDIVRLTQAGRDQSSEVVGITRQVEESAGGNARMVEQLAQASAGLREQGDHLKRSMQHFVFG
ncbi:MAG: methyl-accepting chemotaxis protein [Burkholderiales bacterium]|nr:methyl-accepting chemotaxis protein [Burkholderiales bacterium]